jgi:hypothetical protein
MLLILQALRNPTPNHLLESLLANKLFGWLRRDAGMIHMIFVRMFPILMELGFMPTYIERRGILETRPTGIIVQARRFRRQE